MGTRMSALNTWADLVTLLVSSDVLEDKTAFILQAFQILTTKLEIFASETRPEAFILARLEQTLLAQLDTSATAKQKGKTTDVTNDRLFHLFRVALRAIHVPDISTECREELYGICYRYLTSVKDSSHRQRSMQVVKTAGEILMEVICEDISSGEDTYRIAALLLLDALTKLSFEQRSPHIIDCFARGNFVSVLVETTQYMPAELQETSPDATPSLLAYYRTKLSLLLTIAQDRVGAVHILNAGLFTTITASGLFAADPDIGLEIDNPAALQRYYSLLLFILRIIVALVLSRGPQNAATIEAARSFLLQHRQSMVSIFKRETRVNKNGFRSGNNDEEANRDLSELVELFVLLISATGLMDVSQTCTIIVVVVFY
jgi:nuclear pore complex protein Nup205